jgi:hypothetical protein
LLNTLKAVFGTCLEKAKESQDKRAFVARCISQALQSKPLVAERDGAALAHLACSIAYDDIFESPREEL